MIVKLSNGSEINLDNLDDLNGKSSSNGFLAFLEKNGIIGNGDNIFNAAEISKLKTFLLELAGADSAISSEEIEKMRLKHGSVFDGYNAATIANDLVSLSAKSNSKSPVHKVRSGETIDSIIADLGYTGQNAKDYRKALVKQLKADGSFMNEKLWLKADSNIRLLSDAQLRELGIMKATPKAHKQGASKQGASKQGANNAPTYEVVSGDTVPKIVAKLGYTGADAKKYERELIKQLDASGSFMNDKKWLAIGQKINLLDNDTLNRLGITANSVPVPENTPNPDSGSGSKAGSSGDPSGGGSVPVRRTLIDNSGVGKGGLLIDQKLPINRPSIVEIPQVTADSIVNSIKLKNEQGLKIKSNALSRTEAACVNKYKSYFNVEPEYVRNQQTGELHVLFDMSKTPFEKDPELQTVEISITDDCQKTTRVYSNGKIAQDYYYEDFEKNKSVLLQAPNRPVVEEKRILEPLAFDIEIDMTKFTNLNESQKNDMLSFKNALVSEKANLMKKLDLDSDTYNRYAQLAMCIANQETQFGDYNSAWLDDAKTALEDNIALLNRGTGVNIGGSTSPSVGLTQIKIRDKYDDPNLRPILEEYKVDKRNPTPKQSAIATIAVLADLEKNYCSKEKFINGAEAADGKFYDFYITENFLNVDTLRYLKDGMQHNKMSRDDVLLYFYNGSPGQIRKGNATPAIRGYNKNVEKYKSYFTIKEDPYRKAQALARAEVRVVDPNLRNKKSISSDLSYGIGQVAFATTLYNGNIRMNKASEIKEICNYLEAKCYDPQLMKKFVTKLRIGDIAFLNGISQEELSQLTERDIKTMIEHSDKLTQQLSKCSSASEKRKLALQADKDFKYEYLASRASQSFITAVDKDSVVVLNDGTTTNVKKYPKGGYETGAHTRCNKYLPQLRGKHKANAGLWMAESTLKNGNYYGFIAEKDKGINYNNARNIDLLLAQNGADAANILRTSGGCLTGAKQALIGCGAVTVDEMSTFDEAYRLAKFCEKHPERFEEIKYVQISEDVVREITAGDISKLPAGYIVVYGNKSRTDVAGHAGITSGNGQIYADEADNSNWDNFVSSNKEQNGKGEHGYVRVFRLKDDYYKLDANRNVLVS